MDELISEDGTVTIEQPIMSVEEATIHHFLLSSSASATGIHAVNVIVTDGLIHDRIKVPQPSLNLMTT